MSLNDSKSPQHDDSPDSDELPRKYRDQADVSKRTQQGTIAGGVMLKSHDEPRRSERVATSHNTGGRTSNHHTSHSSSSEASPGMLSKITKLFSLGSSPQRQAAGVASSYNHNGSVGERRSTRNPSVRHLEENNTPPEVAVSYSQNVDLERQHTMQNASEAREADWVAREAEWATREQELCQQIRIINEGSESAHNQHQKDHQSWVQNTENMSRKWNEEWSGLQAKLQETTAEKRALRTQLDDFVLKQQEASFKQMNSGRWLSMDDNKAIHELDRLKKDMRAWAKSNAAKDLSLLQSLKKPETISFHDVLSEMVVLEEGQLPDAILKNAKAPLILLSTLLAHDVYKSFFVSPFSFLGKQAGQVLTHIYQRTQPATEQDAHLWRAQTLRILMPPTRKDSSAVEVKLRKDTESWLLEYAHDRAKRFAEGPARHLMGEKPTEAMIRKLERLYHEAARHSYQLWTRRINMECVNMQQMKNLTFNAESTMFDPDPLVRYDEDENEFKSRKIVVLMHPVLLVHGNDEGDNYDQDSVFAKGIVWFDGKND